jgi:hypothetical protein
MHLSAILSGIVIIKLTGFRCIIWRLGLLDFISCSSDHQCNTYLWQIYDLMLYQSCADASEVLISYGGAHTRDKDNRAIPFRYHNLCRLPCRVKCPMNVDVIQALHPIIGIPSVNVGDGIQGCS